MKPEFCPFCGEKQLEELEPSELQVDEMSWTIHHYECQFCRELFDKIIVDGDDVWHELLDLDEEDIQDMILNSEDDDEQGYQH